MDTPSLPRDRLDQAAIARLLVLFQGAVLVTATAESVLFLTVLGPAAGPGLVLSAGAALLTLVTAWGLGRRNRLARRWTIVAEAGVLALVALGVVVGLVIGGVELTLLGLVLRVGLPIAVIALLRRSDVRAAFGSAAGARAARSQDAVGVAA